jgi:hypothetical protein
MYTVASQTFRNTPYFLFFLFDMLLLNNVDANVSSLDLNKFHSSIPGLDNHEINFEPLDNTALALA